MSTNNLTEQQQLLYGMSYQDYEAYRKEKETQLKLPASTPIPENENPFPEDIRQHSILFTLDQIPQALFDLNGKERNNQILFFIQLYTPFQAFYDFFMNDFFPNHYFDNKVLDLSRLVSEPKPKGFPHQCNFNYSPFSQSLYFLCYLFNKSHPFSELKLKQNNFLPQKSLTFLKKYLPIFLPNLQKVYLDGNPEILGQNLNDTKGLESIEFIQNENDYQKILFISRATDLKTDFLFKIWKEYNMDNLSPHDILELLATIEDRFEPNNYLSPDAYQIHHAFK